MSFLWDQIHGAVSCMLGLVDHGFALMRLLGPFQPKFFGKGYGNLQLYYERVASSITNPCDTLGICAGVPTKLSISWGPLRQLSKNVTLQTGKFTSPVAEHLPPESYHCQFQLVRPSKTTASDSVVIIMLPATGEMGTWQRIATARHLAHQYGWSSIILTAPYYGSRKPSSQTLFFLSQVSDLQFQSQGIIEEATLLAAHFLSASPETKVCFTGYSFGAAMSSVAASLSLTAGLEGRRLGCALYAGCGTPAMMADGILRHSMDWKAIQSSSAPKDDNAETTDSTTGTTPPVGLWEELSKTHLARASPPEGNRLAVAKGYAMEYDAFIPTRYSNVYEQQVQSILYPSFTLSWKLGGHAWAAVMRPLLHTQLIVDTVQELLGGSSLPGTKTLS